MKEVKQLQLMTRLISGLIHLSMEDQQLIWITDPENIFSNDKDSQEVSLYINDPTADFTVTAAVWVLDGETDKISATLNWYLNDSTTPQPLAPKYLQTLFQMSVKEW